MSLTLTLPPDLEAFVQEQASALSEGDQSSYVLTVLREEKERRERRELSAELDKGLDSGDATPWTDADWQRIRESARSKQSK